MRGGQIDLIIANICEPFGPLLQHFSDPRDRAARIQAEHALGDRAVYWVADNKLVVTARTAQTAAFARDAGIYGAITNLSPKAPSPSLCWDILNEQDLFDQIVAQCRPFDRVLLRAYATTDALLDLALQLKNGGVTLLEPERASTEGRNFARQFDTKSGFRKWVTLWQQDEPDLRLPPGEICSTATDAARAAELILACGRTCVIKPDQGESGLGLIWLVPDALECTDDIVARILAEPTFGRDPIVVEEGIANWTNGQIKLDSPSVEVEVTEAGAKVAYTCRQLVSSTGAFLGIAMGCGVIPEALECQLRKIGVIVGRYVFGKGYRGFFDIDFAIDKDGYAFMLEANMRRTGGTHAHDLAKHLYGVDYARNHVVLSRDAGASFSLDRMTALRIGERSGSGFVPTIMPSARRVEGYVVFAHSTADVTSLLETLPNNRP